MELIATGLVTYDININEKRTEYYRCLYDNVFKIFIANIYIDE